MKLLVTGGYFDDSGECFITELDSDTGAARRVLTFVPPGSHSVKTKGFTGAAWMGPSTLLVCSFNAVWRFDMLTGSCVGRIHQPDFNDLHHVMVDRGEGRIYVCNTGLDSIEVFDLLGNFVGRYAMTPAWFEAVRLGGQAVSRSEFQKVLVSGWQESCQPEYSSAQGEYYNQDSTAVFSLSKVRDYVHPNHITLWGNNLAVTCLASNQVRCLRTMKTLATLAAPPHDGVVVGEDLWVTTTDGRLWEITKHGVTRCVLDTALSGYVGWCRGLQVTPSHIAVGLTAIEAKPRYPWRDNDFASTETSVLLFSRSSGSLLRRIDLTDTKRRAKIFSLLAPMEAAL